MTAVPISHFRNDGDIFELLSILLRIERDAPKVVIYLIGSKSVLHEHDVAFLIGDYLVSELLVHVVCTEMSYIVHNTLFKDRRLRVLVLVEVLERLVHLNNEDADVSYYVELFAIMHHHAKNIEVA